MEAKFPSLLTTTVPMTTLATSEGTGRQPWLSTVCTSLQPCSTCHSHLNTSTSNKDGSLPHIAPSTSMEVLEVCQRIQDHTPSRQPQRSPLRKEGGHLFPTEECLMEQRPSTATQSMLKASTPVSRGFILLISFSQKRTETIGETLEHEVKGTWPHLGEKMRVWRSQ